MEVNTGGIGYGLKELHPCREVLKRYHDLGGEIVTVGSDAHRPADICREFKRAEGFSGTVVFLIIRCLISVLLLL